jgi:hypothetical protein
MCAIIRVIDINDFQIIYFFYLRPVRWENRNSRIIILQYANVTFTDPAAGVVLKVGVLQLYSASQSVQLPGQFLFKLFI